MDRNTFDSTLRVIQQRRPYQPFTIALVNGHRIEIDHPDAIVFRDGVAAFVGPGGVPVLFDHEGVSEVIGDLVERNGN
jgi:hypothetical protein